MFSLFTIRREQMDSCLSQKYFPKVKLIQYHPGFELKSQDSFPTTINCASHKLCRYLFIWLPMKPKCSLVGWVGYLAGFETTTGWGQKLHSSVSIVLQECLRYREINLAFTFNRRGGSRCLGGGSPPKNYIDNLTHPRCKNR